MKNGRWQPGDDIYQIPLPTVKHPSPERETHLDCDNCHRKFRFGELIDAFKPYKDKGPQTLRLECPECGYKTGMHFAVDSTQ